MFTIYPTHTLEDQIEKIGMQILTKDYHLDYNSCSECSACSGNCSAYYLGMRHVNSKLLFFTCFRYPVRCEAPTSAAHQVWPCASGIFAGGRQRRTSRPPLNPSTSTSKLPPPHCRHPCSQGKKCVTHSRNYSWHGSGKWKNVHQFCERT